MSINLRICKFAICGTYLRTAYPCVFLKSGRLEGVLQLFLYGRSGKGHLSVVFLLSGTVGRCSSYLSLREVGRVTSLLYSCSLARSGGTPAVSLSLRELEWGSPLCCIPGTGTVGRCSSCLSMREVTMLRNQRAMTKDLNRKRKGRVWLLYKHGKYRTKNTLASTILGHSNRKGSIPSHD